MSLKEEDRRILIELELEKAYKTFLNYHIAAFGTYIGGL